ncbi:uncharacterized protein LOC121381762 [Gigantopelta aegis]|uniref:uncharacterized protein LOC121381762 n=1 Tax=Gigantopelta aegis TaxID=1735272 RepID=UPI001B88B4CA|nr:uncharacterized protein LOC121381762 [Gigantopelta aegis]
MSRCLFDLQDENRHLNDEILHLQTRSKRFNLLFSGIVHHGQEENTEDMLKAFIKKELEITEDVPIQVTHRLGPFRESQNRHRTIVAHFQNLKDKDKIKNAAKKLARKPFGINDQFPREIAERRKRLYPVFREVRMNNKKAVLKVDRLYINGREYLPENPWERRPQENNEPRTYYKTTPESAKAPPRKRNKVVTPKKYTNIRGQ